MSDSVRFTVTAKDDASDDFQRIGKAAQSMGQQVQNAGKASASGLTPVGPAAKNAQKALADVETQAKKTAASSDDIKKKWTEAGAAAGTLVAGLALVGRAYVEQERQIDGLERAYGDASKQLIEFAEEIQQTTVYSNDAARAATLSAASLAQNYGLTADQIENVVKASADLATVTGIDLADATTRVAGAIRGEGEAAELLGLNMSDAAVQALAAAAGIEGWNTTMTEGEKAAFRYSVAMDQAAFATGAAADAAETNAGQARQFVNSLQDQAQALGGAIGPAAEYASVLGSFALAAPVAGAALGRLATGIKIAASALGPVGLIAAGVGAVVVLGEMTDWFGLFGDSAEAAVPPVEDLSEAVLQLAQAGTAAETITRLTSATGELKAALDDISTDSIQSELDAAMQALGDLGKSEGVVANFQLLLETGANTGNAAIDQQLNLIRELRGELDTLKADGESVAVGLVEGIIGRLDEPLINVEGVLADLATNIHLLKTDQITLSEFNANIQGMTDNFGDLYAVLPIGSAAIDAQTRAWEQYQRTIDGVRDSQRGVGFMDLDDSAVGSQEAYAAATERTTENMARLAEITASTDASMGELKDEANATAAAFQDRLSSGIAASTAAMVEHANEISAVNQQLIDFVANGDNIVDVLIRAGGALTGNQGFLRGVRELTDAQGALDSTFQAIIGGSEALAQSGQQVADWASELTGITLTAEGFVYELSAIDEALASGRISQDEYNAAIVAGQDILYNNAQIQADISAIQAQQAPLIADRTNAYQDQVAALAELGPAEQRHALLMMDSGVQAQVASAYSTAYAASLGEIPESVASEIILAEAASNPDTKELYKELGLISEGADGTITVNFPNGESMTETLTTLNSTLDDLVDAINLLNGTPIQVSDHSDDALQRMQNLLDKMNEIRSLNMEIGTYSPATPTTGDGTGGSSNIAGEHVQNGGQPDKTQVITITANAEPYFRVVSDVEAKAEAIDGTEHQLIMTADNTQAIGVFRDTEGSIVAITDGEHVVKVTGDPSDATNDIALVNQVLNDLNGTVGVIYVEGDPTGATTAVSDAEAARNGIDGTSATVSINGVDYVSGLVNSLTGYQGDAYIYVHGVQVGAIGPTGGFAGAVMRDGGIVNYDAAAIDGIVTHGGYRSIMVGEAGREILRVPPGSSVTPAPMTNAITGNSHAGKEVHLHFHNAVYGMDDFQQQVSQAVRSAVYQGQYA
jgi:hypothetical protein